jgi:hypothetical protein
MVPRQAGTNGGLNGFLRAKRLAVPKAIESLSFFFPHIRQPQSRGRADALTEHFLPRNGHWDDDAEEEPQHMQECRRDGGAGGLHAQLGGVDPTKGDSAKPGTHRVPGSEDDHGNRHPPRDVALAA